MTPHQQRPFGTGAFFDYVIAATRDQASRARSLRATLALKAHRLAERRISSAEERWEGEGGNSVPATPDPLLP